MEINQHTFLNIYAQYIYGMCGYVLQSGECFSETDVDGHHILFHKCICDIHVYHSLLPYTPGYSMYMYIVINKHVHPLHLYLFLDVHTLINWSTKSPYGSFEPLCINKNYCLPFFFRSPLI